LPQARHNSARIVAKSRQYWFYSSNRDEGVRRKWRWRVGESAGMSAPAFPGPA
jgi:hypothetical protein